MQTRNRSEMFTREFPTRSGAPCGIASVLRAIHAGRLSSVALAEACLARADASRDLKAFLRLNPRLLDEAMEMDRLRERGTVFPLHGLTFAVKDNIETEGIETTAGAVALSGYVPGRDAHAVARLRAAGALVVGKTNLDELALSGSTLSSLGGQTLNPFDRTRTPAGSSGGSAVAVAVGACAFALGTETVNSIRNPAHACGIAGLRPTAGLVSRAGAIPVSPTMDVVGPMGACVEDVATVFRVMAGYDPRDPVTERFLSYNAAQLGPHRWPAAGGLRVGVARGLFGRDAEHEGVNRVFEDALERLRQAGVGVVDVEDSMFDTVRLYDDLAIHAYEFRCAFDGWLASLGARLPVRDFESYVADGRWPSSTMGRFVDMVHGKRKHDLGLACAERLDNIRRAKARLQVLMDELSLDALAYPIQQRPAAATGEPARADKNGVLASALGWPALNVPVGFTNPHGGVPALPVGLDLLGRPFSEPVLFAIGQACHSRAQR